MKKLILLFIAFVSISNYSYSQEYAELSIDGINRKPTMFKGYFEYTTDIPPIQGRVKNELFESVEKLNTLKIHSILISLRVYYSVFIYLSPLVYNSNILASFVYNNFLELIASLFFSVIIGFVLMALYNIQEYIEDPFDQQGLEDLEFDKMLVGENEILY
tara:strand:+ start:408 stop:887 length:480 start_codon:yes stop_codon:yes gene_type:complete